MFKRICQMSQDNLKKFVSKELKATHDKIIAGDGYVYAQGTFPVLLVAHLDTVHSKLPSVITYDEKSDSLSSPQGIGGDDRCGVYMILEIIKHFNCSVLFCEDEEIGCIGAEKFIKTDLAKTLEFNYIIEFDRKGKDDAVFYNCNNEAFEKFITEKFYKTAWGSFSDISVLAPFLKCAAVNLSCGYYNAHTTNEYVVMGEMLDSIYQACQILQKTTDEDKFEYVDYDEILWNDSYVKGDTKTQFYENDAEYDMQEWAIEWFDYDTFQDKCAIIPALSKAEAIGVWIMDHPSLSFNDIDLVYSLYK